SLAVGISPVLEKVHRPHAAHVVGVANKFSAWGVQADFAAVSAHPAALGFTRTWSFPFLARAVIVIIDTVVVLAQHGQILRLRMATVFMRVDMVDLASIGWYVAVRPRTDEILRHGRGAPP